MTKKWLPFDNATDAQAWIDNVNLDLGYPKNGTTTYTTLEENQGKFCALTGDGVLSYMSAAQKASRITSVEAVAQGYLPEPEPFPGEMD